MQKFQNLLLLLAIAAFTFAACHKHDEDDTAAPVVTLETPTDGAVLSGEVHVHGTVTDASLHEMSIVVTKDSDGSELLSAEPTVHDLTSYSFDEHFTPSGLTGETDVTLLITVEDHSSNKTTKTVKFKVKP